MQSQMQSQAKSSLTMSSNLLNLMVSRAGLEPATTALKVQIGYFSVHSDVLFSVT